MVSVRLRATVVVVVVANHPAPFFGRRISDALVRNSIRRQIKKKQKRIRLFRPLTSRSNRIRRHEDEDRRTDASIRTQENRWFAATATLFD